MAKFITLVVFIVAVAGIGSLIGTQFPADEWYQVLNKPFFNPPGALFGLVWPVLYVLIAIAGWRVFTSEGETPGWGYWVGQMLLNFAWSPVFFGLHEIFWAMLVIAGAVLLSIGFVSVTWHKDRIAAVCFLPYVAWLSFAFLLNLTIWIMN